MASCFTHAIHSKDKQSTNAPCSRNFVWRSTYHNHLTVRAQYFGFETWYAHLKSKSVFWRNINDAFWRNCTSNEELRPKAAQKYISRRRYHLSDFFLCIRNVFRYLADLLQSLFAWVSLHAFTFRPPQDCLKRLWSRRISQINVMLDAKIVP